MKGAGRFVWRILVAQLLVSLAACLVIAIFTPRLLSLESDMLEGVSSAGAMLAGLALFTTTVRTLITLRVHRRVIRALAHGSRALEPRDIGRVGDLPTAFAVRTFLMTSLVAALLLVPGIRPEKLDDGRTVSLLILVITILGAAAIPHYVLARQAMIELIELAPLEPLTTLLETLELKTIPSRRLSNWVLIAAVAPVALMGAGAVLVVHAHLRTFTEQSRRATAVLVAHTALESPHGELPSAGRDGALAAAQEFGFIAHLEPAPAETNETSSVRESDGQIAVTTPLDHGQAVVRFSADLSPRSLTLGSVVGLFAVLVAALLGGLFGRALTRDLTQATRSVRLLGTESVIRGGARIGRPARFAVVESLGRAIDALTQRFRVFAAAQERALEARAAAQRMRGLLFASVSHDLKSPLNAILGFADLVAQEPLTAAQTESLTLIAQRGRELLALIETILDAARVEAGQLSLASHAIDVAHLVAEAIPKARELAADVKTPIAVEIADGLPAIPADAAYMTRALAAIIAHAIRTAATDGSGRVVRIRATLHAEPWNRVRIDVEHASRAVTREELERLFARLATARGRGLTLGLSLARSVVELHGGSIEIDGSQDRAPVCWIWLPLTAPGKRPRLSAFPTLG